MGRSFGLHLKNTYHSITTKKAEMASWQLWRQKATLVKEDSSIEGQNVIGSDFLIGACTMPFLYAVLAQPVVCEYNLALS